MYWLKRYTLDEDNIVFQMLQLFHEKIVLPKLKEPI